MMATRKVENIRQKDKVQYLILVYYSISFETKILNDKEQQEFISFLSKNGKDIADHPWKFLYR